MVQKLFDDIPWFMSVPTHHSLGSRRSAGVPLLRRSAGAIYCGDDLLRALLSLLPGAPRPGAGRAVWLRGQVSGHDAVSHHKEVQSINVYHSLSV